MSKLSEALARAAEIRARADAATEGPWTYDVRPNDRQTGSAHYTVEAKQYTDACPCGGKHPPGKLIAWLSGGLGDASLRRAMWRHDPSTEADARFLSDARQDIPLLLDALEEARALLTEAARDLALQENFQDETLRGRINEALGRG